MEENIILNYISAWNWQILSMLFLCCCLIMLALPRSLITSSFFVALFLIFIVCEYISLKRKQEVQEE